MQVRRLVRGLYSLLALLGLLVVIVTITPLVAFWTHLLSGSIQDPQGDILIVLGSDSLEGGTIGQNSYWRSVYATWAWRQGSFRKLVVSGGGNTTPVAESMRTFLVSQGVPASAIVVEGASADTRQNALFTARLLQGDAGRKILLTSDFHMFRALRVFRKAGLQVEPRPIPDAGKRAARWQTRWPAFQDLALETVKIGYYFAKGWI